MQFLLPLLIFIIVATVIKWWLFFDGPDLSKLRGDNEVDSSNTYLLSTRFPNKSVIFVLIKCAHNFYYLFLSEEGLDP